MQFKYDAFISYSRLDVGWAERLSAGLAERGIQVFRDEERLTAGEEWLTQLQESLTASRHLLVLWSEAAQRSNWVEEERFYFRVEAKDSPGTRRFVFVNLDAINKSQSQYEQVDNIRKVGLYAQGPTAWDQTPDVRLAVLNSLEEALKQDDSIPIYKILLVSTLERLQNIPLDARPTPFAPTFDATLRELGIKTDDTDAYKTELAKYYGTDRNSWRPFGSAESVDAVLDRLRNKIQATQNAPRFRWREPGDEFWSSNIEELELAAGKIAQQLSLVVIDPISLYDPIVFSRLIPLRTYLRPQMSATAVLAPFQIPPKSSCVRRIMSATAMDMVRMYSEPGFDGSALYPLVLCAHDDIEVRRVLCASLHHRAATQTQDPVYLRHGSR